MPIIAKPAETRTTQPVAHARFKGFYVNIQGRMSLDLSNLNVKVMLVKQGTSISFKPLGVGCPAFHVPLSAKVTVNGKVETAESLYNRKKK